VDGNDRGLFPFGGVLCSRNNKVRVDNNLSKRFGRLRCFDLE